MMKISIAAAAFALAPALLFAQKKEQFQEMQRDVNQISDTVRTMNDKLTRLETLVQQAIEASNRANNSVATLQGSLAERIGEQTSRMVGPVAGVGTKVDQMTEEFRAVRENVADMTSRIGRLETKVNDLGTAVRTLSAPPVAPPPAADGGTTAPSGALTAPVSTVSSGQAYQAALTDFTRGNYDLAIREFRDYLKLFPQAEEAPNAQFYIAEVLRRKGDLDGAVEAYNQVIDGYKENNKTPDAFYMKGVTLVQAKKPTAARKEFNEVIKRYPNSDLASKAKSQLKTLGFAPPPGKSAAARPKRRR